eukprot:653017_1
MTATDVSSVKNKTSERIGCGSSSATFLAPIPTLNSRRLNRSGGTQRSGTRTSSVTECEARTRTVSDCAWTEMQCTCTCVALVLVTRRASDCESLRREAREIP